MNNCCVVLIFSRCQGRRQNQDFHIYGDWAVPWFAFIAAKLKQAQLVEANDRTIADKTVQIDPSPFLDRVPAEPPPRARVVISVSVIEKAGLIILILGRKPERIG